MATTQQLRVALKTPAGDGRGSGVRGPAAARVSVCVCVSGVCVLGSSELNEGDIEEDGNPLITNVCGT